MSNKKIKKKNRFALTNSNDLYFRRRSAAIDFYWNINYKGHTISNTIRSILGNLKKLKKISEEEFDTYMNACNEESNLAMLHDIVLEKLRNG